MIVIRRGKARPATRRSADIDELVRNLVSGQRSAGFRAQQVWRPALDVFTTDKSFEVVAELAGIEGDDIEVVIEGDVLSIRGLRERSTAERIRSFYEARIPFGPFVAEVVVPFEIEWDETTANYHNGLLSISLPRRRPRTVKVQQHDNSDMEESESSS